MVLELVGLVGGIAAMLAGFGLGGACALHVATVAAGVKAW